MDEETQGVWVTQEVFWRPKGVVFRLRVGRLVAWVYPPKGQHPWTWEVQGGGVAASEDSRRWGSGGSEEEAKRAAETAILQRIQQLATRRKLDAEYALVEVAWAKERS